MVVRAAENIMHGPEHGVRLRLAPFDEDRELWLDLVHASPGATLYHREAWIKLLAQAYSLPLCIATLHRGSSVLAGCVFARAPLSNRFVSLPFSDSCPPLASEPEAAQQLLSELSKEAPARSSYEIRGIAGPAKWQDVGCFTQWRLSIDQPLARIGESLAQNFKRNLRRASNQRIRVEHGGDIKLLERFYEIQLESRRRLGLPSQPWRFFRLAHETFAADGNLDVWIAAENGRDSASAVFLRDGDVIHYKWGARRSISNSSANHLLFWNAIEEFAPNSRILDLGRTDVRNHGLMRFKKELGATVNPLPSSFYPRAPRQVSAEALTGGFAVGARVWRRLPIFATQLVSRAIYRFLV